MDNSQTEEYWDQKCLHPLCSPKRLRSPGEAEMGLPITFTESEIVSGGSPSKLGLGWLGVAIVC